MINSSKFSEFISIINETVNNNRPKIYISGPVSMYNDDEFALKKFKDKAREIEEYIEQGGKFNDGNLQFIHATPIVVNPVEINMSLHYWKEMDWGDFMAFDLLLLNQCDYIYMMDNWELSEGAKMEKLFAEKSGRINVLQVLN